MTLMLLIMIIGFVLAIVAGVVIVITVVLSKGKKVEITDNTRYCASCGAILGKENKFCDNCGKEV